MRCLELYSVCLYVYGGAQKLNARFLTEQRRHFFRDIIRNASRNRVDIAEWPPACVFALNLVGGEYLLFDSPL